MHKYRVVVFWSGQDQRFLTEVPELPGAMADGPTPEAAVAMAQTIIDDWIAVAKEDGREIPEPQTMAAVRSHVSSVTIRRAVKSGALRYRAARWRTKLLLSADVDTWARGRTETRVIPEAGS